MRFDVTPSPAAFADGLADAQLVFHGINKSGSLAMSRVIKDAYEHAGRQSEFVSHYHTGGATADFVGRVNERGPGRAFVVGHYLFGALKPIPNRVWITQFRHPLPRTVSCYQWLKNKHEAANGTPYQTLSEFVVRNKGVAHSQVDQFGSGYGPNGPSRKKRFSARDLLEISIDQIEANVSVFGIAEYFEESIFAFAAACGLPSVAPWARDDRNKGRKPVTELAQDEVDLIQEHYACDFELYRYALDKLHAQTARLGIEGDALQAYRAACGSQYKDRILA